MISSLGGSRSPPARIWRCTTLPACSKLLLLSGDCAIRPVEPIKFQRRADMQKQIRARRLSFDPDSTAQLFAAVLCAIWTCNDAVAFACVGNTPDGAAGIISDQQRSILGNRKRSGAPPYF